MKKILLLLLCAMVLSCFPVEAKKKSKRARQAKSENVNPTVNDAKRATHWLAVKIGELLQAEIFTRDIHNGFSYYVRGGIDNLNTNRVESALESLSNDNNILIVGNEDNNWLLVVEGHPIFVLYLGNMKECTGKDFYGNYNYICITYAKKPKGKGTKKNTE